MGGYKSVWKLVGCGCLLYQKCPPVTETPKPNVPSSAKVKVLPSAKTCAIGHAILAFTNGRQYTILQTKADRVRLSGINSWRYNRDVEVMKARGAPPVMSKKIYLPALYNI